MAISRRMQAVLQKVDADQQEYFAGLRASTKRDAVLKAQAKQRAADRAVEAKAKKRPTP